MAIKRFDYCYSHNLEMTGFTTLFCPVCLAEAESYSEEENASKDNLCPSRKHE